MTQESIENYKYDKLQELEEVLTFSQGRPTKPSGFIRVKVDQLLPLVANAHAHQHTSNETVPKSTVLSSTSMRVLAFLLAKMHFRNWVFLSQVAIKDALSISPQVLNRALDNLETQDLLQRVYLNKRYRCLIINPALATKGSNNDIEDCQKAYREIRTKNQYRPRRKKRGVSSNPVTVPV